MIRNSLLRIFFIDKQIGRLNLSFLFKFVLKNNNNISQYVEQVKETLVEIEEFILSESSSTSDIITLLVNCEYKKFQLPKKNSTNKRLVYIPPKIIQFSQGQILDALNGIYYLIKPDSVYGYVDNIKNNAQKHVSKNWVLNFDLLNFFYSIKSEYIFNLFSQAPFNFSKKNADLITNLTTTNGVLPIGACTSPVLSNFIFYEIDNELIALAEKHKLVYTRYADDLTFSSNEKPTQFIINDIITILNRYNFELNLKKYNLKSRNERQEVTGLIVNSKVNVKKEYYKLLRAILYNLINNYELNRDKYIEKNKHQYIGFLCRKRPKNYHDKKGVKYKYNNYTLYINSTNNNPDVSTSKDTFLFCSLRSKVNYINHIIGSANPKMIHLRKLFETLYPNENLNKIEESEQVIIANDNINSENLEAVKNIVNSKIVYITNATAKSVVYYAYLYLKNNKIEEPEILNLISECSKNYKLNFDKLKDKFIYEAADFIALYDYLKLNNRFQNFIESNINSGEIDNIVNYWDKRKNTFLPKFYRQVYHDNINCKNLKSNYEEMDGFHRNSGILAHDQNENSEIIYKVTKEFLDKLGMRRCKFCDVDTILEYLISLE